MASRKTQIILSPDELALIRRHIALSRDILERYAHEAENSRAVHERLLAFERRTKEALDEILDEIERINRLLILEATGHGRDPAGEAGEIRSEIRQEQSIQWKLSRHIRNLQYLQEQAAGYGSRAPLDLVNQITDEQEEIQRLQHELKKEA